MKAETVILDGAKLFKFRKRKFKSVEEAAEEMDVFHRYKGAGYELIQMDLKRYQPFLDLICDHWGYEDETLLEKNYDDVRHVVALSDNWFRQAERSRPGKPCQLIKVRSASELLGVPFEELIYEHGLDEPLNFPHSQPRQVRSPSPITISPDEDDQRYLLSSILVSARSPLDQEILASIRKAGEEFYKKLNKISGDLRIDQVISKIPGHGDSRSSGKFGEAIHAIGRLLLRPELPAPETVGPETIVLLAKLLKCSPSKVLAPNSSERRFLHNVERSIESPESLL